MITRALRSKRRRQKKISDVRRTWPIVLALKMEGEDQEPKIGGWRGALQAGTGKQLDSPLMPPGEKATLWTP